MGNITKITDVVYTRILNFTAVKSSHKGNYSCTGNSSAGNETKTEPLPIPGEYTCYIHVFSARVNTEIHVGCAALNYSTQHAHTAFI